jgi:urease accessory protein
VVGALAVNGTIFADNRAVGRLALGVKAAAGLTRRARVHEEGPLRVRFPGAPAGEAEAVLVNTAGGMAGGDRFELGFDVGNGARLLVTTAAAEKVYRTMGPDTTIDMAVTVASGAALAWLPQETILFDGACLRRRIDVELAPDARVLLAEATIFGRSGMGETVRAGRLFDRWRIRRAGRLLHVEGINLDGPIAEKLAAPAIARDGIAMATVLAAPGEDAMVDAVRRHAERFRGEVGASAWNSIAVVRLVARDGAVLRHDLAIVLAAMRGGALPRLWTH